MGRCLHAARAGAYHHSIAAILSEGKGPLHSCLGFDAEPPSLMISTVGGPLENIMRDFASREIIKSVDTVFESRKDWMLGLFVVPRWTISPNGKGTWLSILYDPLRTFEGVRSRQRVRRRAPYGSKLVKMKIGVTFALAFLSFGAFCQDPDLFRTEFFGRVKVCNDYFSPLTVFKRHPMAFKDLLRLDRIVSLKLTSACSDNRLFVEGKDTTVQMGSTYIDAKYQPGEAAIAFDSISSAAMNQKGKVHSHAGLMEFLKPGRIFVLNGNSLRIISFNSCADPNKFYRLVEAIRKERKFEKLFVVMCGVDKRDMRLYK